MTVAELIAELENLNPDAEVVVDGHPDGGGCDDALGVEVVRRSEKGISCRYAGYYDYVTDGGVEAVRIY